jgi:hypothetical protein
MDVSAAGSLPSSLDIENIQTISDSELVQVFDRTHRAPQAPVAIHFVEKQRVSIVDVDVQDVSEKRRVASALRAPPVQELNPGSPIAAGG